MFTSAILLLVVYLIYKCLVQRIKIFTLNIELESYKKESIKFNKDLIRLIKLKQLNSQIFMDNDFDNLTYKMAVKLYHPDRFANDRKMYEYCNEKMKQIRELKNQGEIQ